MPGGLLFLGDSESLGNRTPGFRVADGEHRIFAKEEEAWRQVASRCRRRPAAARCRVSRFGRYTVLRESVPEQHIALLEALVRSRCDPALVLDENHDLVEVIGDVSAFCRLPEGRMSAAAAAYLRTELQSEARALLLLVRADGDAVASQPLRLPEGEGQLRLEARPLRVGERPLTLLSFVLLGTPAGESRTAHPAGARDAAFDQEIVRLERELLASQDTLRRSLAELEQANEELEASSEELQASSEELQSSNEELEASNEELQSTNEELGTINQQLRSRGEELRAAQHRSGEHPDVPQPGDGDRGSPICASPASPPGGAGVRAGGYRHRPVPAGHPHHGAAAGSAGGAAGGAGCRAAPRHRSLQ